MPYYARMRSDSLSCNVINTWYLVYLVPAVQGHNRLRLRGTLAQEWVWAAACTAVFGGPVQTLCAAMSPFKCASRAHLGRPHSLGHIGRKRCARNTSALVSAALQLAGGRAGPQVW